MIVLSGTLQSVDRPRLVMSLYEQIDLILKGSAGSSGATATSVLQPTGGPTTSVLRAAADSSHITA